MKKKLTTIAIAFISFTAISQEQEAIDYAKAVNAEVSKLSAVTIEYIIISAHEQNTQTIETKRQDVLATIKQGEQAVKKIKPYTTNRRLKEEALDLFRDFNDAYSLDYKEAIELQPDKEKSVRAMQMYLYALERAEKKVSQATDQFEDAQQAYLKRYKIAASYDDERREQLKTITELAQYNRKVFLAYFRTAKTNSLFLNEVNEKDLDRAKKLRKELVDNSRASKAELKEIGPFKGNDGYQKAALRLTEYYGTLAGKEYKELEEILENYTKLTQKQADRYKEIVEGINKKGKQLTNDFTQANKKLRQKYTPKSM